MSPWLFSLALDIDSGVRRGSVATRIVPPEGRLALRICAEHSAGIADRLSGRGGCNRLARRGNPPESCGAARLLDRSAWCSRHVLCADGRGESGVQGRRLPSGDRCL